jgi:hypothetical protein
MSEATFIDVVILITGAATSQRTPQGVLAEIVNLFPSRKHPNG